MLCSPTTSCLACLPSARGGTTLNDRSKTDQIKNYFRERPGIVITPREVASDLGLDPPVTVSLLNRIAREGTIHKRSRGHFCFIGQRSKKSEALIPQQIDPEDAIHFYQRLQLSLEESFGPRLIAEQLSEFWFDQGDPSSCLADLLERLDRGIGRPTLLALLPQIDLGDLETLNRTIIQQILAHIEGDGS